MTERWRKPAKAYDAVEGDTLVMMPSGETMIQANVSVDSETIARMLEGYICMNCLEPQEIPFPEMCEAMKLPSGEVVGCYYRMKARQLIDMENKYGSLEEVRIGSHLNLYDESERLREMDEFESRTGIILPPGVKFPNPTPPTE